MEVCLHTENYVTKLQHLPDLVLYKIFSYLNFKDLASMYVAGDDRLKCFILIPSILKKATLDNLASIYAVGEEWNCGRLKYLCVDPAVLTQAVAITGYRDSKMNFSDLIGCCWWAPQAHRSFYGSDQLLAVVDPVVRTGRLGAVDKLAKMYEVGGTQIRLLCLNPATISAYKPASFIEILDNYVQGSQGAKEFYRQTTPRGIFSAGR